MRKIRNLVIGGLQQKIFNLVLFTIIIIMTFYTIMGVYQIRHITGLLEESSEEQQAAITGTANEVMLQTAAETLTHNTDLESYIADSFFISVAGEVRTLGDHALSIYEYRDSILGVPVAWPDPSMDGTAQMQLITDEGVDTNDPATAAEIGLFGNMESLMKATFNNMHDLGSCFIAFPDGVMLITDANPSGKYEDGKLMPMPVTERYWFKTALETGDLCFSQLEKDLFTGRIETVCACPVYSDGQLIAVVGADIFLDGMAEAVNASAENAGFVCILNSDGKVIFSPETEGTFAAVTSEGSRDLRTLGNDALASFIDRSLREKTEMVTIEVDGKRMCMAGAPIASTGWCLLTLVEESILQQPAEALVSNYNGILEAAEAKVAGSVSRSQFAILSSLLAVMVLAMGSALALARKIVSPLNRMTERLRELKQGDSSFTMEDTFKTGDEIQILAETFADLSSRIRSYIAHITEITAEKQRIGTELALAQKIQTDMLPNIFPPFPERDDMDIYAYMKPAKEVGGDFYDFFLIDEDHLALVMADVSGKGIPAALFMMMSKILLNTNTMLSSSPKDILEKVNEQICRNNDEEMFVTVWLSILTLSTGHMVAANAGHEYPILRKPGGEFEIFKDKHGFVIGGFEGTRYREYEMTLEKGGTLFLYTDGVAEATSEDDELFGTDRMLEALNKEPDADAYHILVNMNKAVNDFVGDAPQFDDLTMLAIRRP